MHVITATFEDGHTERYACPCPLCDLWRSVDLRAMRKEYERLLDENIKNVRSAIVYGSIADQAGIVNHPGLPITWPPA